ncbi:MAG: glycosyl transferase family 1 [Rhodospirillaceae bacterium TMED8]|nr:glycosyl transferase family 1 [Magnetovibrio sp.]OUT50867.1 MAG: glycosyl transferase family 1 [Rhodospirillaceae bacterium TMED8]
MLHINDLVHRIGGRILFQGATLHLPKGHKMGLIGSNGTGKTTLLKMILGDISPDEGSIRLRNNIRIGTVAQEAPSNNDTLLEHVLAADVERTDLLTQAQIETHPSKIAEIHTRLADIYSETAPARAARILTGLGFNELQQTQTCSEFSGGWRMRVALAATLFATPDLLLLDEPTNHLDLEAVLWLEGYLNSWPGTLLLISHDRKLLNTVVSEIVHLENQKLTRYTGGYDRFERTRHERQEQDARLRNKQNIQRRHIKAFVERFRYKASKARQAQSRLRMLERMAPIASLVDDQTISFNFPEPEQLPPPLISLDNASVGYEVTTVLQNLNQRIDMDDRIALIGSNGNGKSTLVKLLAGRLKPTAGKLLKSSKLKIGYFAQHQAEELQLSETPYHHLARLMPMAPDSKVRAHLAGFGFSGDRANTNCLSLSGGEKARLLFAMTSIGAPHILLLDEPTNHLDVDAREALIQALNAYDGAVILVSHDPHLVELVADRLWLVANGECKTFEGDLSDYHAILTTQQRAKRQTERFDDDTGVKIFSNKKAQRRKRAEKREKTAGLRKTINEYEKRIEKLSAERESLEICLANPEIYEGPTTKLMEIQVLHTEIKDKIKRLEEAWINLNEHLDSMGEPSLINQGQ